MSEFDFLLTSTDFLLNFDWISTDFLLTLYWLLLTDEHAFNGWKKMVASELTWEEGGESIETRRACLVMGTLAPCGWNNHGQVKYDKYEVWLMIQWPHICHTRKSAAFCHIVHTCEGGDKCEVCQQWIVWSHALHRACMMTWAYGSLRYSIGNRSYANLIICWSASSMYDDLIIWESWESGEEFINQFSSVGGEEGPEFADDDEERDWQWKLQWKCPDNDNENWYDTHLIHEWG